MNPPSFPRSFLAVCCFLFLSGCAGLGQHDPVSVPFHSVPSRDIAPSALAPMPDEETLTYEVRWIGITVGHLTLSVKGSQEYKGRQVYVLEARMQTNEFLSALYHIADRYTSYMDARDLTTLRHEAFRNEGRYRKDAIIEFDQVLSRAHFTNRTDGSERVFDVPAGVHDMMTSFYHLLRVPLSVGDSVEYLVCHNERNYQTKYPVTGTATIRLPGMFDEPVETYVIEPVAYELSGHKVEKGTMKAYYTKEPRRLLLMAVIRGPVFTRLTVSLINAQTV